MIETYSNYGLTISLFTFGLMVGLLVTNVYGQNSTGGTSHDSITDLKDLIIAIGTLIGAVGVVLGVLGNSRTQKVAKYAQTFGQKTVENAHVIERVVRASDALGEGKLSEQLDKVDMPMRKITEHANVATEQLQYLNANDPLPKDPDKDEAMPRESSPMPRKVIGT